MKKYKFIILTAVISLMATTACIKDLDTVPLDTSIVTSVNVYNTPDGYLKVLAKMYSGLALTGQEGPAGDPDIAGIDEGFSSYLRTFWNLQELSTDEAKCAWNDDGIFNLNTNSWSSSNPFVRAFYYRIYYQLTLANEFIRESSDDKLDERGFSEAEKNTIKLYRYEARFLRALSYWHALDLFTDIPFVTEDNKVGAFLPEPISRPDLFEYIESELLAIEDHLAEPGANQYGRADKAAAWTLLAKLYLNAEVYTGTGKYTECITYCNNVINAGYTLHPEYDELFLADNHNTTSEAIFSVVFDGTYSQTWGGTTFFVHSGVGGSMSTADFGIDFGWGGNRTTSKFVSLHSDLTGQTDKRAMFYTAGQSLNIDNLTEFVQGYAITKYKNITSTGAPGSNQTYVDNDFHLFRLADVYLMYAEAVVRGGTGGDIGTALGYVNDIRDRAYGDNSGNISSAELTLDFLLDERGRELFWEAQRRTDLIRFGKYLSGTYLWPWKGGVADGTALEDKYKVFPIPASDVVANPNLDPTPGY